MPGHEADGDAGGTRLGHEWDHPAAVGEQAAADAEAEIEAAGLGHVRHCPARRDEHVGRELGLAGLEEEPVGFVPDLVVADRSVRAGSAARACRRDELGHEALPRRRITRWQPRRVARVALIGVGQTWGHVGEDQDGLGARRLDLVEALLQIGEAISAHRSLRAGHDVLEAHVQTERA